MKQRGKELGIFIIIVVLLAFSYWKNPTVLSSDNLINTSRLIGIYGIMSLGMAFVIITGGIDLSVGSVIALLGVILSILLVDKNAPPSIALGVTVLVGALLGWLNGFLVTRIKLQPFVVTLCGLLLFRGLARFISNDETKGFGDSPSLTWLKTLATGNTVFSIPWPLVFMLILSVVFFFLLHKSTYGRYLFASGYNEESARYAGINSRNIISWAYVICGITTGIAAILFAFYTNSISPSMHGNFYELYAIAAAVLGGCSLRGGEGSIVGVILGTTLLLVIRNLVTMLHIPSSLEFAVMGIVIFVGVLADTLFRKKA
ncbi:MAG: ABC transporter permease [Armatimonadetes bacterium]|nr:ABC transporter permease [Armatimonadota bacterium]MBS1701953.1 ABC transporter permease [Armatimonadota bacterium]MBS1728209.1 ABC transporter permease [Armatimonadota bacterium]